MYNKWNHTFAVEIETVEKDSKEFNKRTVIFKDNKTQESEVVFEDFDSDDLPTKNEKTPTLNNFIISVIQAIGVRKIREMIH